MTKERMNWDELRARVNRATEAFREALQPSPERAREMMDARAVELARRAEVKDEKDRLEVVAFEVSGVKLALETRYVQQISPIPDFTPLPGAGDIFFAVTNLRGEVLPLALLDRLLGLKEVPQTDVAEESKLLVVGQETAEVGFVINGAHDFRSMSERDLTRPIGMNHWSTAFKGLDHEERVLIDGERLLADPRLMLDQSELSEVEP